MKKIVTLTIAFALLIGITYSCEKEDPPAVPTISITPVGLTLAADKIVVALTQDSTIIVGYAIAAEGNIKELKQTLDGELTTVSDAVGDAEYTKQLSIPVTYEDQSIGLELEVTDESDQVVTKTISIDVTATIPPATALTAVESGEFGGNNGYARWDFDVDPMKYYSGWALGQEGAEPDKLLLDVFYDFDANKDKTLYNYDPGNTDWILAEGDNSGAKFAATTLTAADFNAMTDDSDFANIVIDLNSVPFATGDVVLVLLRSGVKCVVLAKDLDGNDDIWFEMKKQNI